MNKTSRDTFIGLALGMGLILPAGCYAGIVEDPVEDDYRKKGKGKGKGKGNGNNDSEGEEEPQEDEDDEFTTLVAEVRALADTKGVTPMPPAPGVSDEMYVLGRALAFDKELSGNRDISCMSCHLPRVGTGDGRNLSIGQGATGLDSSRTHPDGAFIARNAPPLYNMHAMDSLFWDGRVSVQNGTVRSPAGNQITSDMESVFEFGAISVLPMVPVLSREEMRAFAGNELAAIDDTNMRAVWVALMDRLGAIPEYRSMFEAAYPGESFDDMTFAHASNAIGGYIVRAFESDDTKWDEFLAGDDEALTVEQLRGAKSFLTARCSICHSGPSLSDQDFHNVALAQFGPGLGDGSSRADDFGRFRESGVSDDRYAFRSTPLRNVEFTAPYGHAGQFQTLFDFIDHYSESDLKLRDYDISQIEAVHRGTVLDNAEDILQTRDPLLDGVVLHETTIAEVTEFMFALSDSRAANPPPNRVPTRVPSGLSIDQ